MGKLPPEKLKILLSCIRKDPRVIVPPTSGFDSGVHLIDGDRYLVVSTDPCIGVPESWFGWLLIHYVASDIALFGAKAEFCTINLLGPPSTKPAVFHKIMRQACTAADDLGMTIVTGHTGTYEGVSTLLGVCTAYGFVHKNKLITPGGAKPGDSVVCVKPVGLEVAINYALSHKTLAEGLFGAQKTQELRKLVNVQTCVRSASLLAEIPGVHAMHDATEGGLTAALNEIAEASHVGFVVEMERIHIPEEVEKLKEFFQLSDEQVLSMSSTGTIIAAVDSQVKDRVADVMSQNNIEVRFLGTFTQDKHRILLKRGKETPFPRSADDPYERILAGAS